MSRFLSFVTLAALAGFAVGAADTTYAVPGSGDEWEVTSQMTMEGMPPGMGMGAQTRKNCTAKEWTKPPVSQDDKSCETVDFRRSPTGATWKMKCDGMTGDGEITRTAPDAFKGSIKMVMPQGAMTINLSGRRVGDCDAGEARKAQDAQAARMEAQIAAGQTAANDALKQMCSAGEAGLDLRMWRLYKDTCMGPQVGLTAAAYKTPLCNRAATYDGFIKLAGRDQTDTENNLAAVAAFCNLDVAAKTKSVCEQAVKTKDYMVIGKHCPAEAHKLAKEHCGGRSYTSMAVTGDPYAAFCVTYARELLEGGAQAP